jgi:RNA polymerase sigma-70 factor (ECF subfamily)
MDIDALYSEYQPGLVRYLTRFTGDPHEAEDVAQEAYLRLVTKPPALQDNLRGWLFVVATNVVRDRFRKRLEDNLKPDAVDAIPARGRATNPVLALETKEVREIVQRVLAKLTKRERTLLLMREEGFDHREIAAAVGTTTKSVGTMIFRALNRLKKELGDVVEELR